MNKPLAAMTGNEHVLLMERVGALIQAELPRSCVFAIVVMEAGSPTGLATSNVAGRTAELLADGVRLLRVPECEHVVVNKRRN